MMQSIIRRGIVQCRSQGSIKGRQCPIRPFAFRRMYSSGPVIGIDLGTTNSCVSVVDGDKAIVIENDGRKTTPSIFAIDKDGNRYVGYPAARQSVINPRNTFYATKRLIGRRFDEKETQEIAKQVSYKVVAGPNGDAWVADDFGRSYSPSEIASNILIKLREAAEKHLGREVNRAVITVPAYFDNHQRQATEDAGKIAGLKVERIINEPTAAALAYGISREEDKVIAVYDLGGGTFDISILQLGEGVFEVKSTAGDTFLGGEDFNNVIINHILSDFKSKHKIDLSTDKIVLQRIREAAEIAKHDLSTNESATISLPFITANKNLDMSIRRSKLEELTKDLIMKSVDPCKKALNDAGMTAKDITDVILVGGMTRMPKVRQLVKEFFKREPFTGVNPDEAVAQGAALQGAIIANQGIMTGEQKREIVLLDVTPLNLGTALHSGELSVIIPAQTPIPCKQTQTYTTVNDYQTEVVTEIYQGNRPIAKDNRFLGRYIIRGIPPAPRGVAKIDCTFELSANGTLKSTSRDHASGVEQGITITMAGGLSQVDIERLRKEAEMNRESDLKKQELIKELNHANDLVLKFETALVNLSEESKSELSNHINDFKSFISKTGLGLDDLRMKMKEVEEKAGKILTNAYEDASKGKKSNFKI